MATSREKHVAGVHEREEEVWQDLAGGREVAQKNVNKRVCVCGCKAIQNHDKVLKLAATSTA